MTKSKILSITLILLAMTLTSSCGSNNEHTVYSKACGGKRITGMERVGCDFFTQAYVAIPQTQVVIDKSFFYKLESCVVVDKKNWRCEITSPPVEINELIMKKGKLINHNDSTNFKQVSKVNYYFSILKDFCQKI